MELSVKKQLEKQPNTWISKALTALFVVLLMFIKGTSKQERSAKKRSINLQRKGSAALIKEYEKKLSHDSHNVMALEDIGDLYFEDKNWEKVWGVYKTLYDISAAHPEIDIAKSTQRMGIAALNLNRLDDAINSLLISGKKNPDSFETNFSLGKAMYLKQIYDKAVVCFKKCKLLAKI